MEKKIEPSFRILSALAIIFVVAGHADFGIFDMAGLFPYYSFHVGVFVFISGYFYKEENENHIISYIKRKAFHLLLPYYGWNLFYGILTTGMRSIGFQIGKPMTFYSFFLEPFLGGHQYGLNFAGWFVPVLFVIEVINITARKILDLLKLKKENLILMVTLITGMATVVLSARGSVWGYYKHIGCILFLLPVFQGGQFYKKVLKNRVEKLSYGWYFGGICFLQYLTLFFAQGRVAYSAVWCSGFLHGPLVPYLTTFLGIGFWLGVARVLEPGFKKGGWLDWIGSHTFDIMMHHILGFLLLNTIFYGVHRVVGLEDFLQESYFATYEYRYLPGGLENGKWIYLIFGLLLPLGLKKITENYKKRRKKNSISKT